MPGEWNAPHTVAISTFNHVFCCEVDYIWTTFSCAPMHTVWLARSYWEDVVIELINDNDMLINLHCRDNRIVGVLGELSFMEGLWFPHENAKLSRGARISRTTRHCKHPANITDCAFNRRLGRTQIPCVSLAICEHVSKGINTQGFNEIEALNHYFLLSNNLSFNQIKLNEKHSLIRHSQVIKLRVWVLWGIYLIVKENLAPPKIEDACLQIRTR